MKIRTNEGEVELTAEMVCRGMVFRDRGCEVVFDGRVDPYDFGYTGFSQWRTALVQYASLLGCDPTIATRADCERFGVHGDAAAHGFAKLRDGGALDLRRHLPGWWVIQNANGTFNAGRLPWQLPEGARFVGLDARHANPEDVRRLCCKWLGPQPGDRCTLAIGDHDVHEDLATGVKWMASAGKIQEVSRPLRSESYRAKPQPIGCPDCRAPEGQLCAEDCVRVARYKATRCGARPVRGQVLADGHIATGEEQCARGKECDGLHTADFGHRTWHGEPVFLSCPICAARVMPYALGSVCGFSVFDPQIGKGRESAVCEACFEAHKDNVAALRWEGDRLVVNRPQSGRAFTQEDIVAMVRADGYEPQVVPEKFGRIYVYVDAPAEYRAKLQSRIQERAPAWAEVVVEPPRLTLYDRVIICREGKLLAENVHVGVDLAFRDDMKKWAESFEGKRAAQIQALCECGALGPDIADHLHVKGCATVRKRQEAPLVALVNAVPAGLDPVGWRAAVLALREHEPGTFDGNIKTVRPALTRLLTQFVKTGSVPETLFPEAIFDAYQRALAPRTKVAPERKTRGPVIVVDDGRDDD